MRLKNSLESRISMRRLCEPSDVARAAVFIASDAASCMTGQALNISGGAVMN